KERNENGRRAAELYRCGQSFVPCDPQEYVRWCYQSPIDCQILENGAEIGAGLETGAKFALDLAGLTELDTCLRERDLEHCSGLAVDALVGAKLKALEKAYDGLKLLRRGCKILGKTTLSATTASYVTEASTARASTVSVSLVSVSSAVPMAASSGRSCGEHDIPGLPRDVSEIPRSGGCDVCAENIRDSLGGGTIFTLENNQGGELPYYRGQDSQWWWHAVVVYEGRVYDAWTGRAGETVAEYKSRWSKPQNIDWPF
ncbi:hypothetical protein, partial [Streptomyces sp. NPDC060198]|uniref:hypothetical protein n=1 Tax=Streptomyces sp. NPDC060198 TaxID=3347070 RepID=UPI00365F3BE7